MLNRQIDILDQTAVVLEFFDQRIGDLVGIAIENTNPRDIRLRGDLLNQFDEFILTVKITSVSGGILRNQNKFSCTDILHILCFCDQFFHRTGMQSAADAGDCTIGTAVVTAFRDLEVRKIFGCGDNTVTCGLHLGDILKGGILTLAFNRFDRLNNFMKRTDTDQRIDLGQFFKDLLTVSLCQTSRDNNALEICILFQPCFVENVIDGFLLCAFDECTGIDNDNIGFRIVRRDFIACFDDICQHDLGIYLILRAAEGNKSDFRFLFHSNSNQFL